MDIGLQGRVFIQYSIIGAPDKLYTKTFNSFLDYSAFLRNSKVSGNLRLVTYKTEYIY